MQCKVGREHKYIPWHYLTSVEDEKKRDSSARRITDERSFWQRTFDQNIPENDQLNTPSRFTLERLFLLRGYLYTLMGFCNLKVVKSWNRKMISLH